MVSAVLGDLREGGGVGAAARVCPRLAAVVHRGCGRRGLRVSQLREHLLGRPLRVGGVGLGGGDGRGCARIPLPYPEVAVVERGRSTNRPLRLRMRCPPRPIVLGGCCCARRGCVRSCAPRRPARGRLDRRARRSQHAPRRPRRGTTGGCHSAASRGARWRQKTWLLVGAEPRSAGVRVRPRAGSTTRSAHCPASTPYAWRWTPRLRSERGRRSSRARRTARGRARALLRDLPPGFRSPEWASPARSPRRGTLLSVRGCSPRPVSRPAA